MSKVFSVITQKGGVGKTTTVNALAASFTKLGYRVLCVDMDPQGNLSFSVGADSTHLPTVYDAIKGSYKAQSCIQRRSMTDIIPSNIVLSGAEVEFTRRKREYLLKKAITPIKELYDYIFIDSPPGLGFLTVNALAASDFVILPMLPDIFSLQGLVQVYETIEHVKLSCNPDIKIAGIVVNRYNKLSRLNREAFGTAQMVSENLSIPIFKNFIRNCPSITEAQSLQCNIHDYAPRCSGARDFYKLSQEIIDSTQ